MASGNDEDSGAPSEGLDIVWCALGFMVGAALVAKYAKSIGAGPDERLETSQGIIVAILLLGPLFLFAVIAEQLRKEVGREKISWATYWTTLFSIAVAAFTLLGITGVDDLFNILDGG